VPSRTQATSSRLTTKRRGEIAEAAFLIKAAKMGFSVAKPWGDSDPYDFIVQSGRHCWRVQVKSAFSSYRGGYQTSLIGGTRRRAYTVADIDFLVAYAVPDDVWYIVPVDVFRRVGQVRFYPGSRNRTTRSIAKPGA
jgi:PD-(D/E)XK nuclease superfamily protein